MMYEHVKENFINNFLNPYYRWTTGANKIFIITHIKNNCIFPAKSINNDNTLQINLGDNVIIDINLIWETKNSTNKNGIYYRLIKFE